MTSELEFSTEVARKGTSYLHEGRLLIRDTREGPPWSYTIIGAPSKDQRRRGRNPFRKRYALQTDAHRSRRSATYVTCPCPWARRRGGTPAPTCSHTYAVLLAVHEQTDLEIDRGQDYCGAVRPPDQRHTTEHPRCLLLDRHSGPHVGIEGPFNLPPDVDEILASFGRTGPELLNL